MLKFQEITKKKRKKREIKNYGRSVANQNVNWDLTHVILSRIRTFIICLIVKKSSLYPQSELYLVTETQSHQCAKSQKTHQSTVSLTYSFHTAVLRL